MGSKGLRSLAIQLKNSPWERIASQAKVQPAAKEISKLPWQCGEPVAVESLGALDLNATCGAGRRMARCGRTQPPP